MSEKTDLAKIESGQRGMVLHTVDDMRTAAQIIHQSKLAPKGYDSPEKVFVGLQSGAELGLKPMQSLNSIYVVYGKPTLWGDAALALVKKSGLLKEYTEEVTGEGDKMVAKVRSIRDNGNLVATVFTVADAKRAKLWNKVGTWQTHPDRMLKYKARAFNLRDNFPDVLMGMHIMEEMLGVDIPDTPQSDVEPRDHRRKPAQDVKVEDTLNTDEIFQLFIEKSGIENVDEADGKFQEYAAFVLALEIDEVDSPEKFTPEMLAQLELELETKPIPEDL